MACVETVVVVVAELLSEQLAVLLAYYHAASVSHKLCHGLLTVQLSGVLQSLVVVAETAYSHAMHSAHVLDGYVEVANQIAREVVTGYIEQQTVLVDRVGSVNRHVYERSVALSRQLSGCYRVAVGKHGGTSLPHIVDVELAAIQLAAFAHALDNHSGERSHTTLGILLHHGAHVFNASCGIAIVQLGQSAYEDKLVAVGTEGETAARKFHASLHFVVASSLESVVCSGVERVFDVYAEACILHIIGVGQQHSQFVVRIVALQQTDIRVGCGLVALSHIEQKEVIIGIGDAFGRFVLAYETQQTALGEREIVELVLEYYARIVECVHNQTVAFCLLLVGEWYLRQVVFALVRVGNSAVGQSRRNRIGNKLCSVSHSLIVVIAHSYNGLVGAPPVVYVLALAPEFPESSLALTHSHRVVEVPLRLVAFHGG